MSSLGTTSFGTSGGAPIDPEGTIIRLTFLSQRSDESRKIYIFILPLFCNRRSIVSPIRLPLVATDLLQGKHMPGVLSLIATPSWQTRVRSLAAVLDYICMSFDVYC